MNNKPLDIPDIFENNRKWVAAKLAMDEKYFEKMSIGACRPSRSDRAWGGSDRTRVGGAVIARA